MDLEHLSKHQIVLLTLLVSFVSSIATGIVTVSLLDQAPPGVTKTINQIVEHTIEKVVPATQNAAAAVVTQKTVVVKDDDLTAQSIASVQKSIIRIVAKGDDQLVARGIIIDGKGKALTDSDSIVASPATDFEAILYSGERVPIVLPKITATSTAVLTIQVSVGTSTGFAPAGIADPAKLQLGQSVIRIGGTGHDIVGAGIIASLPAKAGSPIEATVSSSMPGSVLMTLFGEVIGVATTDSLSNGSDFYTVTGNVVAPAAPTPATKAASNS